MYYGHPHRFYCGVDLHARTVFVHILDHKGKTVFERDLPADPAAFLKAIQPYRKNLVVGPSACSPGTGWPTCVRPKASPSPWATPWP